MISESLSIYEPEVRCIRGLAPRAREKPKAKPCWSLSISDVRDPRGDLREQFKANVVSLVSRKLGADTGAFVESCLDLADNADTVGIGAWAMTPGPAAISRDDKLAISLWMLELKRC